MFRCAPLTSPSELEQFREMCTRQHYQLASHFMGSPYLVAAGAYQDDVPIGLLLGIVESKHIASIRSVYVMPNHRRRGVATELIHTAENIVEGKGIEAISLAVHLPSKSEPIRGVIGGCQWRSTPRRLRFLTAACHQGMELERAPWRRKRHQNPRIEVFPWHEVTPGELNQLATIARSDNCWFPIKLSPLVDNTHLYKPLSIGLRYDGEVIGWSLAHRYDDAPINFSIMFAKPIPEYPLAGFNLLQTTADLLIEHGEKYPPARLCCAIVDGNKFFDFMERMVFRYLKTEVREVDVYCKEFTSQELLTTLMPLSW